MASRLKALGLALIAVLALSAVAASGAWAAPEFTAEEYPATVDATTEQELGSNEELLVVTNRNVECEVAHFAGEVEEDSSTLALSIDYTDDSEEGTCKAAKLLNTTITENDCKYVFHMDEAAAPFYFVSWTLECPEDEFEIHIGSSCSLTVHSQKGTGSLTAINWSGGSTAEVTVGGKVSFFATLHSRSALVCGAAVGEHSVVGSYSTSSIPLKAQEHNGSHVGIALSGE